MKRGEPTRATTVKAEAGATDPATALRVARVAARGLLRSKLPSMAAALAFRSLFALVPVLVIGLVIVRAVAGQDGVERGLRQILDFSGVTTLVAEGDVEPGTLDLLTDPILDPVFASTTEATTDVSSEVPSEPSSDPVTLVEPDPVPVEPQDSPSSDASPETSEPEANPNPDIDPNESPSTEAESDTETAAEKLDDWITRRVSQVMDVSLPAIGAVGFAALVYAALSMLFEIERSFNTVYRVRASSSWVRRLTQYWAVLTLGGFFLSFTFYVGGNFESWASAQLNASGSLLKLIGFFVTVAISTLLFGLAYQAIPATRVHVRASLAGACIAAVLWEIGKWGLTQGVSYFVGSSTYAKIYGALALLPIFMLWVYYTWLIVLFGLQVAYGLQHLRTWNEAEAEDSGVHLADASSVLAVLAFAARRFAEGKPTPIDDAATAAGLPGRTASAVVDRLVERGLLRRAVEDADATHLARPATAIPAGAVLDILDTPDQADAGIANAARSLRVTERAWLNGKSLQDLIDQTAQHSSDEDRTPESPGASSTTTMKPKKTPGGISADTPSGLPAERTRRTRTG